MPLPKPEPGLVIHYEFLWSQEHEAGQTEGEKRRPAVIVAIEKMGQDTRVTVAPITHSSPRRDDVAVEIPPRVKAHLGLDSDRSWVVLNELNQFVWPGFDLYPIPGAAPGTFHYGFVPPRLHAQIRDGILKLDEKTKAVIGR